MKVKLSDIVDSFEMQSDESTCYLDVTSGQVVIVAPEYESYLDDDHEHPEWMEEPIETIRKYLDNPDGYLKLPSQWDINEYSIMRVFCEELEDADQRGRLLRSIRGRGAFRRFKDTAARLRVIDSWYRYRDERLTGIAVDWCEENGIEYSRS